MMISPEGYYEEYLKGKNEKQIMSYSWPEAGNGPTEKYNGKPGLRQ